MSLINVTDEEFQNAIIENEGLCLVDFWAEWCGPCKQVSPILEEIASDSDFEITIAKVNIDENPRTPTNYGVRSIPTLMLFSNGELKDTKVGALPRQELKDWIKENSYSILKASDTKYKEPQINILEFSYLE